MTTTPDEARRFCTTVAELREVLTQFPSDAIIIMAKDGEGNDYSPYADIGASWYEPVQTWSGETHESEQPGTIRCVVLMPIN